MARVKWKFAAVERLLPQDCSSNFMPCDSASDAIRRIGVIPPLDAVSQRIADQASVWSALAISTSSAMVIPAGRTGTPVRDFSAA